VVLFVLRWRASRDMEFPRYARFGNAFIETSMPSVMIFTLSHHMHPETVFGFWPPLLYFVFILLSTLRLDFWLSLWTGVVAAVQQFLLVSWFIPLELFSDVPEHSLLYNLSRSLVLLGSGAIAGIVAGSLRRQFDKSVQAAAARDRITNMFGQHVSPAVVDRLLAQQSDPPSETREVCVLFLDIRGFTAMTRTRPAGETVALLNDFFAEMIDIVDRNNGIINKFLGDGFLAMFGAPLEDPKAAVNALAAGRGMLAAVDRWNEARPQMTLRVGIGIHLGEAVTGTVGSPRRKEYTVIGDTVNLAARLEQLTKETGSQLLISSSVHRAAAGADGATDLGPLAIRGYDEEVRVWKVV
jgi:adenylate cyclase